MEEKSHELLLESFYSDERINLRVLTEKELDYLAALSKAGFEMLTKQEEAYQVLKDQNVNIKYICQNTGFARGTVYNNPILKHFVDYLSKRNVVQPMHSDEERIRVLNEKIQTFYETDNALCKTEYENKKLLAENARLKALVAKQETLLRENGVALPSISIPAKAIDFPTK